jgi:hypothetical protein
MKLPVLSGRSLARAANATHSPQGERNVPSEGSASAGVSPSGECGCARNRHCLGPCVLGSCLGSCIPNV